MLAMASALICDVPAWRGAFEAYRRTHPKSEAADLYKFAHQGIMGSEHAVPDTASVRAWMQREISGLSKHPEPPPYRSPYTELLPPDGRFMRVHLRPYLAQGGSSTQLLKAFVETANGVRGDTAQFVCAERALASSTIGRDARVLEYFRDRRREGFAATHHSAAFEAAYAPAYRVISVRAYRQWLGSFGGSAIRRD